MSSRPCEPPARGPLCAVRLPAEGSPRAAAAASAGASQLPPPSTCRGARGRTSGGCQSGTHPLRKGPPSARTESCLGPMAAGGHFSVKARQPQPPSLEPKWLRSLPLSASACVRLPLPLCSLPFSSFCSKTLHPPAVAAGRSDVCRGPPSGRWPCSGRTWTSCRPWPSCP